MFRKLGQFTVKWPRLVIALWLVVTVAMGGAALSGYGAGGLFERMESSAFSVPGSESEKVSEILPETQSGKGEVLTLVVRGVDTQAKDLAAAGLEGNKEFTSRYIESLVDPWSIYEQALAEVEQARSQAEASGAAQLPQVAAQLQAAEAQAREQAEAAAGKLVATDHRSYLVILTLQADLHGEDLDRALSQVRQQAEQYLQQVQKVAPQARLDEVSKPSITSAIMDLTRSDLVRGETLSMPAAALIMLIVFGGLLAAGLPLVGAGASIVIGLGAIWVATFATTIDSVILNVISIIGVALSIDYGLLVVSRFREEALLDLGARVPDPAQARLEQRREVVAQAVVETVATAGRTVTFSAITIAFSLAGLLTMSLPVLRNIGLGGVVVTLLAVAAAITLVPALLRLFGHVILHPSPITRWPVLGHLIRMVGDSSTNRGAFSLIAHRVEAHPWRVLVITGAILIVMCLPLANFAVRNNFHDYIPAGSQLRQAYDTLQDQYPRVATAPIQAVLEAAPDSPEAAQVKTAIESLPHVTSVQASEIPDHSTMTRLDVRVAEADQTGPQAVSVMEKLRALQSPAALWVGGAAALQADVVASMVADAPLALGVIIVAVVALLLLMTGSLIIPLKALVINGLSLLAALGATSFIFQNGLFGLTQITGLETFIVACMVAFGFGLAMDYEVFLLARIKEFWDKGFSNTKAVEMGLQRSGRIITSAAAIIIAVFFGFASGQMLAVKEIGVALAIMVAADATVTRLFLVPATMTILGRWNWWAPAPLARLIEKIGLKE